jgi:GT2 family glycosyltransferase
MTPALTVVIVNFNTRDATIACLESVLREDIPGGLEVVVVDNGSRDGSAAAIGAAFPSVVLVDARANIGFARGVNRGVAHSSGEFVLLLNPDTVVLPGSLALLVDGTLRPDGSLDPSSCWGEPTLWSLTMFALGLSTAFKRSSVFDPESLGGWERDSLREVPIVTGCLLLVSRDEWDRLGGMNERFFLYGEDADFSMRARQAGLRPVVVPGAVIVHEVGGSTASGGVKMCMVMAGKVTLLRESWSPPRARFGVALLLAGSGARAVLERAAPRGSGRWSTVWRRRVDWRLGYPEAESTLFGPPSRAGVQA